MLDSERLAATSDCRLPRYDGYERLDDELLDATDVLELLREGYKRPRYIVEHLIPHRSLVLLSGDTGGCKSSFAIHVALAVSSGLPVAGRFSTSAQRKTVLYVNGEMGEDSLRSFIFANLSGLGLAVEDLSPRALFFHRANASRAILGDGNDTLSSLITRIKPALVILDTFRALSEIDEVNAQEVRAVFKRLSSLRETFGCSIVVAHHLRKLATALNGPRERVSGSRDLIASADTHLALRSRAGNPMTAIVLDKTRTPYGNVVPGTEWSVEASWLDGDPPISRFTICEPSRQTATPIETAQQEILAMLVDGPKTIAELGANGGSRKRAVKSLRQNGLVLPFGKRGRAVLLGQTSERETVFDTD